MIIDSSHRAPGSSLTNLMNYYERRENKRILRVYGPQLYRASIELENKICITDPLKNHQIEKKYRTKLVNWLFEVFLAMNCQQSTIYLTIHLLDSFLFKYPHKLKNDNIHLLGVCCLYSASKFEDLSPIFMHDLKFKVCHGRFGEKDIKELEKLILETLDFGVIITSSYDFLKTYFFEFRITNKIFFSNSKGELNSDFNDMEKFAVYISKVILHFDEFSGFRNSMKAICCIVISFEIVRTQKIKIEFEEIIKKWILSLMENSGYDPNDINQLYNRIAECYSSFHASVQNGNLQKYSDLPY